MSNCTDCNQISNCGMVLPSSCIKLSRDFSYACTEEEICFPTLEDLLRYYKPILCKVQSDTNLLTLDRTCYTSEPNTDITVYSVFQELIGQICGAYNLIEGLTLNLNNYYPNYHLETLQFKCIDSDPCTSNTLSVITVFQRLIDKICSLNSQTAALQALYDSLPYQYNIDFAKYPCISKDIGKSDLENLFVKVNEICKSYGSPAQIANALTYDQINPNVTTLAGTLTNLWLSVIALRSGGSSGSAYTFDNFFSITGSVVSINCTNLKNNCITPDYIRSQFSQGANITISPTGVISTSNLPLTTDTNVVQVDVNGILRARAIRVLFYETGVGLSSSDDLSIIYSPKAAGITVLTLPIVPAVTSGSTPTPINVELINAGTSLKYIPGVDYTINPSRTQITLTVALAVGDIVDVNYF